MLILLDVSMHHCVQKHFNLILQLVIAARAACTDCALKITSAHVTLSTLESTVKLRYAPFPASTEDSALHLTPANALRASQEIIVRCPFVTLPAKMVDYVSARTPANALMATLALHVQSRSAASHVITVVLVWHLTLVAAQLITQGSSVRRLRVTLYVRTVALAVFSTHVNVDHTTQVPHALLQFVTKIA